MWEIMKTFMIFIYPGFPTPPNLHFWDLAVQDFNFWAFGRYSSLCGYRDHVALDRVTGETVLVTVKCPFDAEPIYSFLYQYEYFTWGFSLHNVLCIFQCLTPSTCIDKFFDRLLVVVPFSLLFLWLVAVTLMWFFRKINIEGLNLAKDHSLYHSKSSFSYPLWLLTEISKNFDWNSQWWKKSALPETTLIAPIQSYSIWLIVRFRKYIWLVEFVRENFPAQPNWSWIPVSIICLLVEVGL